MAAHDPSRKGRGKGIHVELEQARQQAHELAAAFESRGLSAATADKDVVLVLLVSSAHASWVIGRSGETISEIKQMSGARISFDRAREFSDVSLGLRKCRIQGGVAEVVLAVYLIVGLMHDCAGAPSVVDFVIADQFGGGIVGKKGENLTFLRSQTGSRVNLERASHPALGGRQCTAVGDDLNSVAHAVALILLMDNYMHGSPVEGKGGKGIAPRGHIVSGKGGGWSANGDAWSAGWNHQGDFWNGKGAWGSKESADSELGRGGPWHGQIKGFKGDALLEQGQPPAKRFKGSAMPEVIGAATNAFSSMPGGVPLGDDLDASPMQVRFLIPTEHVALFIGKGAGNLAMLRSMTHVKVEVAREEVIPGQRMATMTHPLNGTIRALHIIACMMGPVLGSPQVKLVISPNCGALVGKNGMNLKRLRHHSGCNINLEREDPGLDGRTLTLVGRSAASVTVAAYDALRCLKQTQDVDPASKFGH